MMLEMLAADIERRVGDYGTLMYQHGFLRGQIKGVEIQIKTARAMLAEWQERRVRQPPVVQP